MAGSAVLANLDAALPAALSLLEYTAGLAGLLYIASGIGAAMKKSADPRGVPGASAVSALLAGGALLGLGYLSAVAVDTLTMTTSWSDSPVSALAYWNTGSSAQEQDFITLLKLVQVFGYAGMFRGIMLSHDAGKTSGRQQAALEHPGLSAAMHIFFSALAINIKGTIIGVSSFFNLTLPSFLT